MNETQLDRIEAKLDRLLAARDIDPNPGVIIEAGERFAPGTGRIQPIPTPDHPARYDFAPHLAEARRTLRATPTDANRDATIAEQETP